MENSILTEPETSTNFTNKRIVAINSTAFFVLAYLVIYTLQQLATVFAARSANIPLALFQGHIHFKISDNQWTKPDVILTYAAGPVLCLFAAIIFVIWFNRAIKFRGNSKVFFLWAFIHGLNIFFGSLLAGCVVKGGFWYAVQWLVINYTFVWVIAGILGLLFAFSGIFLAPAFLLACNSITLRAFGNRRKMLAATLVYPWFFGSIFILLLKFPDLNLYEGLQLLTLLLFLIPAYFHTLKNPGVQPLVSPRKIKLETGLLVFVLAMALIFRIILQNGINFN